MKSERESPLEKSNKDIPLPHAFPYLMLLAEHQFCTCEPPCRPYHILQDVISEFEKHNWNRGPHPAPQHPLYGRISATHELSLSFPPGACWQHHYGHSGIKPWQVRNNFGLIIKTAGTTYITKTSYNNLLLLAEFRQWNKTRNAKLQLMDQVGQVIPCSKMQHLCPALGHLPGLSLLAHS